MAARLLASAILITMPLLTPLINSPAASAQQIVPQSNGFTIGTSSGRSSSFLQVSRSEASVLVQQLSTNISTDPTTGEFRITNPLEAFSVIDSRHSKSSGDSTTSIGAASLSGFNFSVFAQ